MTCCFVDMHRSPLTILQSSPTAISKPFCGLSGIRCASFVTEDSRIFLTNGVASSRISRLQALMFIAIWSLASIANAQEAIARNDLLRLIVVHFGKFR